MPERGPHCPFLNRSDDRCSQHFHLDQLNYAFEHCFDRFMTCPTYVERLMERRLRMNAETTAIAVERDQEWDKVDPGVTHAATHAPSNGPKGAPAEPERPVIQLSIARRFRSFASKAAAVS